MISKRFLLTLLISALFAGAASIAAADIVIPTNIPGGADTELREELLELDPNGNPLPAGRRGALTELGTRIQNNILPANETGPPFTRSDRSSNWLIRWSIRGITLAQATAATDVKIMTHWQTSNMVQGQETATSNSNGRLKYTYDPPPGGGANGDDALKTDDNGDEETRLNGLNYYALNPGHPANSHAGKFIENPLNAQGVDYYNAPGMLPDGDIGTIDIDPGQTVFLGNKKYPSIGTQNHLASGDSFVFDLASLKTHLINAINAGDLFINVLVRTDHDANANFPQFTNFNSVVMPKELLIVHNDTSYDADVTNPNNPLGSPYRQMSNANGEFSPKLILSGVVPEPTSLALLGLGCLSSMSMLRRRRT